MAKQDKIIAGILLVQASLGVLWIFWVAAHIGFPLMFLAQNLALALSGIVSALGWFRRQRWAVYLCLAFYLMQLVQVLTPTFNWSFTLGFNLTFYVGGVQIGRFGINFFALGMLIWAGTRAFASNGSSKPKPAPGTT